MLALHDVDDAERFVGTIVARSGLNLSPDDREDLLQFLLTTAWELSLRYERGDPAFPSRFASYAAPLLRLRVTDWRRKRFGRTRWAWADHSYERRPVHLVSLDAGDDPLGESLAGGTGDLEADRDPSLGGCSPKQIARETKISLACVEGALEDLRLELAMLARRGYVLERLDQLALPPL